MNRRIFFKKMGLVGGGAAATVATLGLPALPKKGIWRKLYGGRPATLLELYGGRPTTLLDLAEVTDPDGSIAAVIEILNETNEVLDDMSRLPGGKLS